MLSHLRRILFDQPHHTSLGRWCLQASDKYRDRCAWDKKAHFANEDCGPHAITKPHAAPLHSPFYTMEEEDDDLRMHVLSGTFFSLKKSAQKKLN